MKGGERKGKDAGCTRIIIFYFLFYYLTVLVCLRLCLGRGSCRFLQGETLTWPSVGGIFGART